MHISFRIIGILFFLFMAIFFDFRNGELRFEMLTGVCENYDFSMQKCASGENLSTVSLLPLFFDPPSSRSIFVMILYKLTPWIVDNLLMLNKLKKC